MSQTLRRRQGEKKGQGEASAAFNFANWRGMFYMLPSGGRGGKNTG